MNAPAMDPVGTHVSGRFNSTQFTNCCKVAVTERERCCPSCRRPVRGREEPPRETCPECRGHGMVACGPVRSATCTNCHGRGTVRS